MRTNAMEGVGRGLGRNVGKGVRNRVLFQK